MSLSPKSESGSTESGDRSSAPADRPEMSDNARKAAIGFILLTLFLDILGIGVIIPVLPEIVAEVTKGTDYVPSFMYGALIGCYALAQFVAAPIIGGFSDRFGRRPVLLLSILGLAIDFLLTYLATNLVWLFFARIASGITAANITASNAYIADISTPQNRIKNFGLSGATIGIAFVIGPAIGGWLGQENPRLPFLVAATLAALNFIYGFFVLPESLPPEKRSKKLHMNAVPFAAIYKLGKYPVVSTLAITIFFCALAQQALQSTWILYNGKRFQWDSFQNGLSMTAVGVLTFIMQAGLIRHLTSAFGPQKSLFCGLIAASVAHLLYGLATEGWMMYAIMLVGCFAGLIQPVAQATIARIVPAEEQGTVQGSIASLGSIAAVCAPPIATGLFGYFSSETAPVYLPGISFFLGSACIVIGALNAWRIRSAFDVKA
jgi:MFS transporter, DHA1 family, tetracycline resistance protein